MKAFRLVAGVLLGMIVISVIAESIEFSIVRILSEKSFEYLSTHQDEYFAIRNQTGILVAKLAYNSIAAIGGGYIGTWIAKFYVRAGLLLLIGIQVSALVWGGFVSELASTGPVWMWLALIIITPPGIYGGYRLQRRGRQSPGR